MAVGLKEFARRLVESGLMTADQVLAFRDTYPRDARPTTGEAFARELSIKGKLTNYQAARILAGQHDGLILGNNVILEKIGEGGMGEVFRAEHRRMKRIVVVKVLRPELMESEYAVKRFQREVQAAAQLVHPNIVTAYDADEDHGIHFLVMEYVEGENLGSLAERHGPLPVSQALHYVAQAARGLEFAHSKGIVHRDIKPSNLLLDATGTVRILDMGLARFDSVLADNEDTTDQPLTNENQIVGTVEYMPPEQAEDSAQVDRRSDIYSLGCTLFRLLVGRPPYRGETPFKTLIAHRVEPVPSLCDVRPDVSPELDAVFRQMVAKRPGERLQTIHDVLIRLAACPEAAEAKLPPLPVKRRRRSELAPTRTMDLHEPRPAESVTASISGSEVTTDSQFESSAGQPRSGAVARVEPAVGMDLGTTFSLVAHLDDQGRPHTMVNIEGDVLTPSALLFDGLEVVVGKEAIKAMSNEMDAVAECVKRELGSRVYHKSFDSQQYPPEVLQAWILNKLRGDARRIIGDFQKVVITVPAYFDETRRKATQDAGYMAGLEVLDIINEPTAAALAFAYQQGYLHPEHDSAATQRILVYDLGGGTFDVTVMEIRGPEFTALATDGDVQLGGRDWDQRIVDYVAEQFIRQHGLDPREDVNMAARLWRECEDAKRTLSARKKTNVVCEYKEHSVRVDITRQTFHELTHDLLERTAFTTRATIRAAGLEWKDIDRVLLVGGSTRMPAVVEMLRELSGKEPDNSVAPDEAVAHGAALHAGLLLAKLRGETPRFQVANVNSHSLGVVGTNPKTKRQQNVIVIPRNTRLPATAKRVFKTQKPGQTSIHVQIVEGESTDPAECSQLGKCTVRGLPPNLPKQTPIEVCFHYEENGRLRISVDVAGAEVHLEQSISRENSLSRGELDQWRRRISGLPTAEAQTS